MAKTLSYRWFGAGAIPTPMRPILESEGIVLLDEGIRGSVTLRRYRAPGRRHGWHRSWFSGSIVMTRIRLAAFQWKTPLINMPLDDHLDRLDLSIEDDDTLRIAFEASDFADDRSGQVVARFQTEQARSFVARIRSTARSGAR